MRKESLLFVLQDVHRPDEETWRAPAPRSDRPKVKADLIAELVSRCESRPGHGCRKAGRKNGTKWCLFCRAADTLEKQTEARIGLWESVRRLNKRAQMLEAAAGAKSYAEEGRRIAKYLHDQIRDLREEILRWRRLNIDREIRLRRAVIEDAEIAAAAIASAKGATGVYFVESAGFIKIGISGNVRTRLRTLNQSHGYEVRPLGFIEHQDWDSALVQERALHDQFAQHRRRGEWFTDCDEIRAFVAANASGWPGVAA